MRILIIFVCFEYFLLLIPWSFFGKCVWGRLCYLDIEIFMLSLHRHTGNLQTHICNFTYNRALVIFSLQKTTNLLTIITNLCRQPRCNCPSCKPPFGSWDCNVSSRPPSCLWQWCNCGGDGDVDLLVVMVVMVAMMMILLMTMWPAGKLNVEVVVVDFVPFCRCQLHLTGCKIRERLTWSHIEHLL